LALACLVGCLWGIIGNRACPGLVWGWTLPDREKKGILGAAKVLWLPIHYMSQKADSYLKHHPR